MHLIPVEKHCHWIIQQYRMKLFNLDDVYRMKEDIDYFLKNYRPRNKAVLNNDIIYTQLKCKNQSPYQMTQHQQVIISY